MAVPVVCSCGKQLTVSPEFVGKHVRCPVCQGVFVATPVETRPPPAVPPPLSGARLPPAAMLPTVSRISAANPAPLVRASKAAAVAQHDRVTVSHPGTFLTGGSVKPALDNAAPKGIVIPGYELLGELGRGGMGVVYKARQLGLNRIVALKMLLDGSHAGPAQLARFRAEAEAVARLRHAHIVQIHEVGDCGGRPFFSLEFIEGGSLDRKVRGTPLPPREAATLVEKLAQAMHAVHQQGIVHRDLKPANVLLTADGSPKITDFGLAKDLGGESGQTASGAIMGTPSYMAPEQAAGKVKEIGPLSDVYALGAILYELLTGRPPFKGATVMDTLAQVIADEPVPPSRLARKVPRDLETICLKCLRKEMGSRYTSAGELAEDLHRFLGGEPIEARPVGTAERALKWVKRRPAVAGLLAGMVLVTILGVAGILWKYFEAEWEKHVAQQQTLAAKTAESKANEETQRANAERDEKDRELTRAEGLVYSGQLALAQQFWKEDRPRAAAARDMLDACRWDFRGFEHALLRQHFDETHMTLRLDQNPDRASSRAALNADGKRLAASSEATGQVAVWDTRTGQELLSLKVQPGFQSICLSPDGGRLALAVSIWGDAQRRRVVRSELKVWDVRSGKELFAGKTESPNVNPGIQSVRFLADSNRLASLYRTKTVQIWNSDSGEILRSFDTSPGATVLSSDARLLASLGSDGASKIRDLSTGRELCSFQVEKRSSQLQPFFSPDGRFLAYQSTNGLKIYDTASGRVRYALNWGNRYSAQYASLSPGGKHLATGSYINRTTRIWELATGRELHTLTGHTNSVSALCFSPDGKHLASGSYDETVRVWDIVTGRELYTFRGHTNPIVQVIFLPDGRRIASIGQDASIKLWDLSADQGHYIRPQIPVLLHIPIVSFSPDGRRIVCAPAVEIRSEIADINGFTPENLGSFVTQSSDLNICDAVGGEGLLTLKGHRNLIRSVHYSNDGRRLVSGTDAIEPDKPGELKVWDAQTGRELLSLSGHSGSVRGVRFSPDGRHIAAGTDIFEAKRFGNRFDLFSRKSVRGEVKVWDADTGRELQTYKGHQAGVTSIAYSPDGKLLASGGYDRTVRVWDTAAGQEVRKLLGHKSSIYDVCFSPDGKWIASAGGIPVPSSLKRYLSGEVIVWDAATGRELLSLRGHTAHVWVVCFSPDGKRLASASKDGTVKLWDTATGRDLLTLDGFHQYSASISFSPDGKRLAYPAGGMVKIWEKAIGQDRLILENYPTEVRGVGFSDDQKRIVLQTSQGKVRAWNANSGREVLPCTDAPPAENVRAAVNRAGTLHVSTDGTNVRIVRVGDERPSSDIAFARWMSDSRRSLLWHRRVADESEYSRAWFTAAFHLRQLVAAGGPDAEQLKERLRRCEAKLRQP